MSQNNDVLIVIPARKGSSFHRKNIQMLSGRELIRYTFDASHINYPHDTLVTTDDPYVIDFAVGEGFQVDERPSNLCDDFATLDEVISYIAATYEYKHYILLPPTSPLRKKTHVEEAIDLYFNYPHADSLVSVTGEKKSVWATDQDGFLKPLIERTKNRQEETPLFISNGAIFISNRESILKNRKKISGRTINYVMDQKSSIDVHESNDLKLAEFWMR